MKRIATYDDRYKQAVETRRMILILLLALRKPIEKAESPAEETGEVGA